MRMVCLYSLYECCVHYDCTDKLQSEFNNLDVMHGLTSMLLTDSSHSVLKMVLQASNILMDKCTCLQPSVYVAMVTMMQVMLVRLNYPELYQGCCHNVAMAMGLWRKP